MENKNDLQNLNQTAKPQTEMSPNTVPEIDQDRLLTDNLYRATVTSISHKHFFSVYLHAHAKYESAPMHHELFDMTESKELFSVIMAFRGSGKSTISSFSFPMWAILGHMEKKFVVLVSKTQDQAHRMLDNIRQEFEQNPLLRQDFGIVHEENSPWNTQALCFNTHGAMIAAISIEQAVRGVKFRHHRPDLIIFDDIEDRVILKTKAGRDALFERVTNDFMPAGSPECRALLIGSNLHKDSTLNRMIEEKEKGAFDAGVYIYPIQQPDGSSTWPGLYKDAEAIAAKRRQVPDARAWNQEYELNPTNPDDQIVQDHMIHYYDFKDLSPDFTLVIGVDPAAGLGPNNDYTAIVPIALMGAKSARKMYVLPDVVNKRMEPHDIIKEIKRILDKYPGYKKHIVVEAVAYQSTLARQIQHESNAHIHEYFPKGSKEDRLWSASGYMSQGSVFFLKEHHKLLVEQILGFGVEKYDDLVDALSSVLITIEKESINSSSLNARSLGLNAEEARVERALKEQTDQKVIEYFRIHAKQMMEQGFTIRDMGKYFFYLSDEDKGKMLGR